MARQPAKDGYGDMAATARRARADLPEVIADSIRTQIIKGVLKPGSKLPTERELGEYHGVSRVVVREAIARLRHEGLATSQQGKGVFVASPEDGRFLTIMEGAIAKPEDFRKLYELRKILESGTAALAAQHRDAEDIAALEDQLDRMVMIEINAAEYIEADMSFHRAIASSSKNAFLVLFISFVDSKLKESIALALSRLDFRTTVEVSAAEHRAIFNCIEARDSDGARMAMQAHLENSSKRLGI